MHCKPHLWRAAILPAILLAGAGSAISTSAATRVHTDHVRGAELFYDAHPANGGKAGYVLVVRFAHRPPKGTRIVGRLGANFPVTALDADHACYSGGIPGFANTATPHYGQRYRVRVWTGSRPDPDHSAPNINFLTRLHTARTGLAGVRQHLGCTDPNHYLG